MIIDDDLDAYVALPRIDSLRMSPDGARLVAGLSSPNAANTGYARSLWEIDPDGVRPARRLTRSDQGESIAGFTPEGDLLFTSARPRPGSDDTEPALWLQPAAGGDARVLASPAGGVGGVVVSGNGTVVFGSELMPSAVDPDGDRAARTARTEAGVSAILHESYPVRFSDHDLGPARTRLLTFQQEQELRDLTGHVGGALDDACSWDLTPDGGTVIARWAVAEPRGSQRYTVVAIDVASGARRTLADDPGHEYESPCVSPDGTQVALVVVRRETPGDPGYVRLGVVPVAGGPVRVLSAAWDRRPEGARWTPDGTALITAAADHGRAPLWRVAVASGEVTRLTPDDGGYSDYEVSPDGCSIYALRSAIDSPPAPVRIALDGSAEPAVLPSPAPAVALPGRLAEITAAAADGTPLRAWIALPHTDTPAPLLLWIHGGPLDSWNRWSWRWNPWLAVARGYAVLLPDPALSLGYGEDFIRRGWNAWGGAPYTDLMTLTDAAEAHPEVDATRTAAMGPSFGGYMANWIAGHTGRFAAIVSHAGMWAMEQFGGVTDMSLLWQRELTPAGMAANSPHAFAREITTPMLITHGNRDYRVPISEALQLWWALMSESRAEHRFLYFPDETHWVTKPGNVKVWHETVFAFLDRHVLGKDWVRPGHV